MILPLQEKKRTYFRKAMENQQQDTGGSQSQGVQTIIVVQWHCEQKETLRGGLETENTEFFNREVNFTQWISPHTDYSLKIKRNSLPMHYTFPVPYSVLLYILSLSFTDKE